MIISLRHHLILYVNVTHTHTNTDHDGTGKGTTESRLDFSQQNCVLKNNIGFGWNSDLKLPTAQCEVWDDYCAAHPSARLYKTTTLPNYEELNTNGIVLTNTLRSLAQHVQRQASHYSTQRQDLLFVHYFSVLL